MFTAAVPKAMSGWINPHFYACRGQIINNYLAMDRPTVAANLLLHIRSWLFWKMSDWSTLVIEGGFIFCIFSLPASRLISSLAVLFHTFVFYSMSILFSSNLAAYACLLDFRRFLWNARVRHAVSRFRFVARRVLLPHLIVAAIVLFAAMLAVQETEIDLSAFSNNVLILGSLAIAVISLLNFLALLTDRLVFGRTFPLRTAVPLVILYDGECGLCDKWVQFVLRHDRRGGFRFAPLQSLRGKELLRESGSPPTDLSSMVLVVDNQAYLRSTGALMILRQLGGFWSLLGIFGMVPLPLRDFVYSIVAANRHRWFPKDNDSCPLPSRYERERFLS
jgi:predicted DCC family thiol-disulfide oxidoreductase YuxK